MTTAIGISATPQVSLACVTAFILKVRQDGECWRWTANANAKGYGKFKADGRYMLAHRVSLMIFRGIELPKGCSDLVVDHLCGNKFCVRPDHLEPVTPRENQHRAGNFPKPHCPRGHEYVPSNTTINQNGSRICRTCKRARRAARVIADRQSAASA